MYTIGQVANFLGVSRDTLKFYEEKELVKPKQDDHNGYRKYNHFDIYDIMTINFYREIDVEIKMIQDIRKSMSVKDIEILIEDKEQKILEEIEQKNLLLKRIRSVKADCQNIKQYLGGYTIREMEPLEVKGELTNFASHDEYTILQNDTDHLKRAATLTGLRRIISFNEEGVVRDRFVVVSKVEDDTEGEVLTYPKCIYMIIEDGRWLTGGENIDGQVGDSLRSIAAENEYELLGLVYINTVITVYEDGLERAFLELYAPIA
ncbi:MerR family transcriptional regulator [Paenibacillus sp. JCM 10914]|uniref:MerR family transcriptional regulator n=1 Tax=Paenibacillus sp. JCM 10914 TaxID=1236974 RepID=UPI0003CC60DA|nr:MerR family transcriptional regulator [Paenibacillus sp. JCM 10914]GAE06265.1 transcriptional regulator, MerR family [Paenibacillus sp. JCM 10914]